MFTLRPFPYERALPLGVRALQPVARSRSSGPLGALLSSPALDVRLITALQVLQVLRRGKKGGERLFVRRSRRVRVDVWEASYCSLNVSNPSSVTPSFSGTRSPPRPLLRRRSTIKLLYGPGIASPGLALSHDIVHMGSLYNVHTDTEPPRARPGPPRPSLASGGPPAAARCGGVTNPTTEHRDAVGRSEAQLGVCIDYPGLSPGPINRRLRRRGQELLFTPVHTFRERTLSLTFIVDSTR